MASRVGRFLTFVVSLIFLQSTVLGDLQCYQCRGSDCTVPTADHEVTCDLEALLPPSTVAPEPTTDSDMNFDQVGEIVQVVDVPLMEDIDSLEVTRGDKDKMVIDASDLPGADRFSFRKLAQLNGADDLRCVYARYDNGEGESTVRTCAIFDVNNDNTCLSHVQGEMVWCYVCDTDLCNSAGRSAATMLTLVAALAAAIRFYESC